MLSLSEFKKLAGKEAKNLSDEEIEEIDAVMSQLADHLFDMWIDGFKNDENKNKGSAID